MPLQEFFLGQDSFGNLASRQDNPADFCFPSTSPQSDKSVEEKDRIELFETLLCYMGYKKLR